MHVEGLLPANLCLVTVLSSEQCLQFERFRQQHVQMVTILSLIDRLFCLLFERVAGGMFQIANLSKNRRKVNLQHACCSDKNVIDLLNEKINSRSWHPHFNVTFRSVKSGIYQ